MTWIEGCRRAIIQGMRVLHWHTADGIIHAYQPGDDRTICGQRVTSGIVSGDPIGCRACLRKLERDAESERNIFEFYRPNKTGKP